MTLHHSSRRGGGVIAWRGAAAGKRGRSKLGGWLSRGRVVAFGWSRGEGTGAAASVVDGPGLLHEERGHLLHRVLVHGRLGGDLEGAAAAEAAAVGPLQGAEVGVEVEGRLWGAC